MAPQNLAGNRRQAIIDILHHAKLSMRLEGTEGTELQQNTLLNCTKVTHPDKLHMLNCTKSKLACVKRAVERRPHAQSLRALQQYLNSPSIRKAHA